MLMFQSTLLCAILPFVTPMFGFGGKTPPSESGSSSKHSLLPSGPFSSSKDPVVFKDPEGKSHQKGFSDGVVILDKMEELHFPSNGKLLCSYNYASGIIESVRIKAKHGDLKIEKQAGGATSYSFIKLRVEGSGTVKMYIKIKGEKKGLLPKSHSKTSGFTCSPAQTKNGS